MRSIRRLVDPASVLVIALTLVLFVIALFEKGVTHDLLLEAGVFLVSVKLILMSYKQSIAASKGEERLERIEAMLARVLGHGSGR